MNELNDLAGYIEDIRQGFEAKNEARDQALKQSRSIIRHCSLAIRAVHRDDWQEAETELESAKKLVDDISESLTPYPDLYHAGYTQDALKEYSEANLVHAFLAERPIPGPADLGVEDAAYLAGLGEMAGELRRRVLDIIRHDQYEEAERLLSIMDEVYGHLVTMDYPDAITRGLRRITDIVRGVTERTRGDLTTSYHQYQLKQALDAIEATGRTGSAG